MSTTLKPTPAELSLDRDQAAEVQRYMPLVRGLARRYHRSSGVELDDLIQVASMGLIRAIRRFDPTMGRLFEAYASSVISGEIMHYLRDNVPLVRPPRELVELRPAVRSATSRLTQQEQREPSCAEIAAETGLAPSKVAEVLAMERQTKPLSLDAELESEEEGAPMRLQLTDQKYRSFQMATEDRIMLSQAMAQLPPLAREVVDFFFYEDMSQQEIGRRLGISQTQVSRRLRTALNDLWGMLTRRSEEPPKASGR